MYSLNLEQRQAVEHGQGPLLVIAGPGSGKTQVITQRIVWLLDSLALKPENVLALTFTDKAAGEMQERVRKALGDPAELPHISTFHALCHQVLRRRHFERRLLNKIDLWIFLRQRMEHLGLKFYQKLAEPGAFLHDLNDFFSRCQDELIEPLDFEAYVTRLEKNFIEHGERLDPADRKLDQEEVEKAKELARVFRNSRRLVEQTGFSSLGSLISETVRLWDREADVLEHYRARFRYVLVDEFQDTNFGQLELLRRLVAPPWNITAVGDDDQAIYRFRGAAHGAFKMFEDAFPRHSTVHLHRNYRSTRKILRCADVVIARNERYEKKPQLKTEKDEGCSVFLLESPDYASEAAWIAEEIERLAKRGQSLGDIAVLYRGHNYRDPLVQEFRRRSVPFTIRGLSILSTVILRDIIAYLNLVASPHDNIGLTRVLLAPRWRFPEDLALTIRQQAARHRCSLFSQLEAMEQILFRAELESTGWGELKRLLEELRAAAGQVSMTALLELLTAKLGLIFLPADRDALYIESFRKFLQEWEKKSETAKLREFMEYFRYFREAGGQIEAPEPENARHAVRMMTVHAAKGLEFPVVFVVSVAPQRFPHREQESLIQFPDELRKGPEPPANIHLQEERRLFFVAMTRARERLYVSSVARRGRKPSAFVDDLLSDAVVAARDIERIQVAEIGATHARPCVPERDQETTRAGSALHGEPQGSLFSANPRSEAVHPDLVAWTAQPIDLAPGQKLRLSASAIEDYRACPLKFKLSHYLKVPTGPQAALTFGNIMHQCVRYYFELGKIGVPREEDLEAYYLSAWKDVGFEDSYQGQAYKQAGLEQLREFVERHKTSAVSPQNVRMEERFCLDLGDALLEGRIDQINLLGHREVELIDYKTGRPRSQEDAESSLQLSIYALAARDQLKMTPTRLTFYNLTDNQPVSTVRTERDLKRVLDVIREVAEQIRLQLFSPAPGFVCRRCDFVPVCPAHEEEY